MAETKYVVRMVDGRESEPLDTMTAAILLGIESGLPFDQWTVDAVDAEPLELARQDWPGPPQQRTLPQTTVTVCGRDLVFLGSPGPLLPAAVRQLQRELEQMKPGDPRD